MVSVMNERVKPGADSTGQFKNKCEEQEARRNLPPYIAQPIICDDGAICGGAGDARASHLYRYPGKK